MNYQKEIINLLNTLDTDRLQHLEGDLHIHNNTDAFCEKFFVYHKSGYSFLITSRYAGDDKVIEDNNTFEIIENEVLYSAKVLWRGFDPVRDAKHILEYITDWIL